MTSSHRPVIRKIETNLHREIADALATTGKSHPLEIPRNWGYMEQAIRHARLYGFSVALVAEVLGWPTGPVRSIASKRRPTKAWQNAQKKREP